MSNEQSAETLARECAFQIDNDFQLMLGVLEPTPDERAVQMAETYISAAILRVVEQKDAEIERLNNGLPHEQPLHDMPIDRQIVMLNRQLSQSEQRVKELEAQLTEQSSVVTKLCLAIDPTFEHGPESDKIARRAQWLRAHIDALGHYANFDGYTWRLIHKKTESALSPTQKDV